MKDSIGFKRIEGRDRQFLVENIIHSIEFNNPHEASIKKTEIINTVESNYKISRQVYQSAFVDVADSFIDYFRLPDPDEIQELDDDLRANVWGAKSLLEIENAYELLTVFQMFYYLNGRLPLTNGLLIVPDGETP